MTTATASNLELLSPATLGDMKLENRMILAPLTRCRAGNGFIPQPMNTIYYAQRASAGLIISEATQVARNGLGYANTPGIYDREQNDMHDSNPAATFGYLAEQLNRLEIAYLHVVEPRIKGNVTIEDGGTGLGAKFFRPIFKGIIIETFGFKTPPSVGVLVIGWRFYPIQLPLPHSLTPSLSPSL